jgi:XTP/dITP diphosphohydrolase
MIKLVFATNNAHKLEEVRAVFGDKAEVLSLKDINCFDEIPETADTLEGNALLKAMHVYKKFGYNCFADDTGLEVDALGGKPGVYSARYAGEEQDSQKKYAEVIGRIS